MFYPLVKRQRKNSKPASALSGRLQVGCSGLFICNEYGIVPLVSRQKGPKLSERKKLPQTRLPSRLTILFFFRRSRPAA
jgi:hypothetical protein